MDNTVYSQTHCSSLENGFVYSASCQRRCYYICMSQYKKSSLDKYVDCDSTTGKWLTSSGHQPCIPEVATTTEKAFDFDTNFLDKSPYQYENKIDFGDYKTYKPPDVFNNLPDFKVPTVKPFYDYDDINNSNPQKSDMNSGAIFGLIIAGIIGTMILTICLRVYVARFRARRRQERIARLVEQMDTQVQRTREAYIRRQRQSAQSTPRPAENANGTDNDNSVIFILRIRRFLGIPSLSNPFNAFRNPQEPPPYDAESVPPPAYEETEGSNSFTTVEPPAVERCTERAETPADPPPPYTENIV